MLQKISLKNFNFKRDKKKGGPKLFFQKINNCFTDIIKSWKVENLQEDEDKYEHATITGMVQTEK